MNRYNIQAKRKNSEEWSEWTEVDEYGRALDHMERVKELGYDADLKVSSAVRKLWDILGENETELTDKILDAGFCLRDIAVSNTLDNLRDVVHRNAVFPENDEESPYISLDTFDKIIQAKLRRVGINEE
jgi:hypothetical protein